ncbi:hypothetical protein MMC26_006432 [Xylographa opegraphella]|nr:hypothetical protein [Xylographa opegraphella]
MEDNTTGMRSTQNSPANSDNPLPLDVPLQTRHLSPSSSDQLSADGPSASSRTSHTQRITRTNNPSSHTSSKGKARRRHSASRSTTMGYHTNVPRDGSMVQLPVIVDPAGEITYTPTTHRISKAKKGKKVHACQHPNCGKIFTRAEHRKRHEANHLSEPLFTCPVNNCKKPFHRADLLSRHMERHIQQSSSSGTTRPRQTPSVTSSAASSNEANSPETPGMSENRQAASAGSATLSSATMSIGSIIEPIMQHNFSHGDQLWNRPYQLPTALAPRSYAPDLVLGLSLSDDSPLYSSDSCYSPGSEAAPSQVNAQPYLPRYAKSMVSPGAYTTDFTSHMAASGATIPTCIPWAGLEENSTSSSGLGVGFEGQYPTSVGISQSACITHEQQVDSLAESITPSAFTFMERSRGTGVRAESAFSAGMVESKNGLVTLDDGVLSHYWHCYWENFYPHFPIVHRPSPLITESRTVLNTILLAIGAQFSSRPHAKSHSSSWFSFAWSSCATLDKSTIHSGAPIDVLQAIVLLEILGLYRSRWAGVYRSQHFEVLYSSLNQARERFDSDQAACVQRIPRNSNVRMLQEAHRTWADFEARRRILLTAFVIDTQRSTFFQQQPCQTSLQPSDIPTPCSEEAWECADSSLWFTLVSHPHSSEDSPFQRNILQSLCIHAPSATILSNAPAFDLTLHALFLATNTLIPALLTVAAESWLFARKVEEPAVWTDAKLKLRSWVQSTDASKAVWHAGHVLRAHFARPPHDPVAGLHEPWSLYLAALVCWAYGFAVQPQPQHGDLSADAYLAGLDVQSWSGVEGARAAGGTRHLLARVRTRLKGEGTGALVTEAERVLERLVGGRGRLSWF